MKKKLRITYNAPVVLSYVLLCLMATALGVFTKGAATRLVFSVWRWPLTDPLGYLRLFGHVLGHSGWQHFISNAMYLLLLGPMLEEKYGPATMIKVIVLTALVTGLLHCILSGDTALCGASGVVFACILLASFTSFKSGEIPLSFLLVAALFIGSEIYSGLTVQDNISNLTHVLGGGVGGFLGFQLNRKK